MPAEGRRRRSSSSIEDPASILVLKPSSLGDIVHTLPAVALIKRRWPAARLRWLINPEWAPLLEGNPHVDEVVIFPRSEFRGLRGWLRIPAWARSLGRVKADLVLDFQGLLRSALIGRLCRGGELTGISDAREGARFFYDCAIDVRGIDHAVDRYLALATSLGIDAPMSPLEWPLPAGTAPGGFDSAQRFVLLHPFARGEGKSLSAAQIAEFCTALGATRVVVAGRAAVAATDGANVIDLLNRTALDELIWLIRHAAFVVSVDSGPMHIAAALTPHLVAIHTWSDPRKVGPYRGDAWVWQDGRLFQQRDRDNAAAHLSVPDMPALAAFVAAQLCDSGTGMM